MFLIVSSKKCCRCASDSYVNNDSLATCILNSNGDGYDYDNSNINNDSVSDCDHSSVLAAIQPAQIGGLIKNGQKKVFRKEVVSSHWKFHEIS
eukprot:s97_g33.t1